MWGGVCVGGGGGSRGNSLCKALKQDDGSGVFKESKELSCHARHDGNGEK